MSQTTAEGNIGPEAEATRTEANIPAGWQGILDPGEKILWQGRPRQDFHIPKGKLFLAGFGALFAGFAAIWMMLAALGGGFFWMFGLIHFSVGLSLLGSALFGETLRHRATWYTLTDRRAFIATKSLFRGRELRSFEITPDTRIKLRGAAPATLVFGHENRVTAKRRRFVVDLGFERIDNGEEVLSLMRQVQKKDMDA